MKRLFDVMSSAFGLLIFAPVMLPVMLLVWLQDRSSPFYIADRVGRHGQPFRMVKLRSMIRNADRSGVDSTSAKDNRITPLGRVIRRYKLDELTQLWNVFKGDMSLVGPRPNVKRETDLYTAIERRLLEVQPGITDYSSIVFSDEGDILKDQADPDIAYNQLIRPGKSRLGLFYVDSHSLASDVWICAVTALALVSRKAALEAVARRLAYLGAPEELQVLARRRSQLVPTPPPGATQVVVSRDGRVTA